MAALTKSFSFSAAHRLHSPHLSDEQNREIFGKCNNLHGHGHNYELEVTVTGSIDPQTGMVFDLVELMQVVQEEVIERFDHKHLNRDTEEFRNLNPTGGKHCPRYLELAETASGRTPGAYWFMGNPEKLL